MSLKSLKSLLIGSVCFCGLIGTPSHSQQAVAEVTESFTSENAILDTSILFAIGAREARQELRGAFGWPTFQEGLADGVYFRFDPDGYARFSPSPRLDSDVFEVICRPRTYSCVGRKNGLGVALTSRGNLQLRIENLVETDQFFVVDGISELPLPSSVLQPLEPRLELLLASGGELVVKRKEAEAERISLVGFSAIAAYLRWIAARQDYSILPRGWPVPNSNAASQGIGLTQAANWQSPMPQPLIPQGAGEEVDFAAQEQIAEIAASTKGAFELLKDIAEPNASVELVPVTKHLSDEATGFLELSASINALIEELRLLRAEGFTSSARNEMEEAGEKPESGGVEAVEPTEASEVSTDLASQFQYLVEVFGLPPDLALEIANHKDELPIENMDENSDVITGILEELKAQLEQQTLAQAENSTTGEYKSLSDYFQSVMQN